MNASAVKVTRAGGVVTLKFQGDPTSDISMCDLTFPETAAGALAAMIESVGQPNGPISKLEAEL